MADVKRTFGFQDEQVAKRPGRATGEEFRRIVGDIFGPVIENTIRGTNAIAENTARGFGTIEQFGRGVLGIGEDESEPKLTSTPEAQKALAERQRRRDVAAAATTTPQVRTTESTGVPGISRVTSDTIGGAPLFTNVAGSEGVAGFGIPSVQDEGRFARAAEVNLSNIGTDTLGVGNLGSAGLIALSRAREARGGGFNPVDVLAAQQTDQAAADAAIQAKTQTDIAKGIQQSLRSGGIKESNLASILGGLAQNAAGGAEAGPSLSDVASLLNAQTGVARLKQQATEAEQRAQGQTEQSEAKTFREILKSSTNLQTGVIDPVAFRQNLGLVQETGGFSGTPQQFTRQQAEAQLTAAGTPAEDIKKILDEQFPGKAVK